MRVDLRKAIITNWPMKVTALALATVLWATVAAEEPTRERIPVAVSVQPPPGRAVTHELPPVRAEYRGSPREILKLVQNPPFMLITVPDDVDGPTYTVQLSEQRIILGTDADVVSENLEPRTIELVFDTLIQRVVPVESRVRISPDSGFNLLGVTVQPGSVSVIGPAAQVRPVESAATIPLLIAGLRSSIDEPVAIDSSLTPLVRFTPGTVTVAASIAPEGGRVFPGIPVTLTTNRPGLWTAEPSRVSVTVSGPGDRLGTLTRDDITVRATPSGANQRQEIDLVVTVPPDYLGVATPSSVVVRRRDGA